MRTIFLGLALGLSIHIQAQTKRPSLQFAQTHFGISTQWTGGGHTNFSATDGSLRKANLPYFMAPRIDFGGLHFWGRADFYVSVPLSLFTSGGADTADIVYTGLATGAHWYPWGLKKQCLRPFAGINWSVTHYSQSKGENNPGPDFVRHKAVLEAGITYTTKRSRLLELGILYTPSNRLDYPVSRNINAPTVLPLLALKLGYKFVLDFTRFTDTAYQERFYRLLRKKGSHSGLTLGLGLSSAFSLSKSVMPGWLQNPMPIGLLPDAGLGYYFGGIETEARISCRRMTGRQEAYGLTQTYSRKSIAAEVIKFKGNYHGLVPFLGLGVSHEWLRYREEDEISGNSIHAEKERYAPVLIAGWDIRPSKAEVFILRTNLRYTPRLSISLPNRKIRLDQLEINFIQLVLFPQRIITHRKHKSEI